MSKDISFDLNTNPAEFEKIQIIGRGGFGCVYELKHIPTGLDLAGKQINEENLGDINKQALERENNIMKQLVSPYAVRYYGKIIFENQLTVLMDFCDRGSLRDIMNFKNKTLTEPQIAFVMHDLLTALQLIHNKKILHRDIKAANILATSHGEMKLTDFGVSRQFAEDAVTLSTITTIGTPYWMAPEVITPGKKYTFPADIWSVGATAVELAEGGPPYAEYEPSRAMIEIRTHGFPGFRQGKSHSTDFQDFVNKCMIIDPKNRPKVEQLLQHTFIKQISKLDRMKVLEDLIKDPIDFSQLVDDEYEEEEEEEEEAQEQDDDDDDSIKSLNFNNPTIVASNDKIPKSNKKANEEPEPEPEEEEEDEDDGLLKPLRFDNKTIQKSDVMKNENLEQNKEENPEPKKEESPEPSKEENAEPKKEEIPQPSKEESLEPKKESDTSSNAQKPPLKPESSGKTKQKNDKTVMIVPVKKSSSKKFSTRTQGPSKSMKNQKRFETFIQPSKESVNDLYARKVESKPIKIDESLVKETKETVPIQSETSTVTQSKGGMNKMTFYGIIVLILAVLYLALGTKKFVLILILLLPVLFLTKNLF